MPNDGNQTHTRGQIFIFLTSIKTQEKFLPSEEEFFSHENMDSFADMARVQEKHLPYWEKK
jgi:hypothetical protein